MVHRYFTLYAYLSLISSSQQSKMVKEHRIEEHGQIT